MKPTRDLLAALVLSSALAVGICAPALAHDEHQPTTAEAAGALATADQLAKQAQQQAGARDDARARLDAAALAAGNRLEAYSLSVRAQEQATVAEQHAQDELTLAQEIVGARKAELGKWIRLTYQQGVGLQGDPAFTALLSTRSNDAGTTLAVLRRLGQEQVTTLQDVQAAQARASRAADGAAAAAAATSAAAVRASSAKEAADAALAQQRDLVAAADSALDRTYSALDTAKQRESLLNGSGLNSGRGNTLTGKVGSCKGGQVELFRNGRIPLASLCPLWSNTNHYVRADAAYGFNRLSKAYVQQFGAVPCITDSYRTYASQVRLFKVKPGLAAKPGTSNHGWGTALDLCGGIQRFGTAQYRWMLANAPLYGWFHPSWARKGGGREEPWHWEFAG